MYSGGKLSGRHVINVGDVLFVGVESGLACTEVTGDECLAIEGRVARY